MPLSNAQFDSIMDAYSQRRLSNYRTEEARREEVYQKIPELAEIDSAISGASLTLARNRLTETDDASASTDLHALIQEKKEQRLQLLQQAAIRPTIWIRSTPARSATTPALSTASAVSASSRRAQTIS